MSVMQDARVGFWDGAFILSTPEPVTTIIEEASSVVVVEEAPSQSDHLADHLAQEIADIAQGRVSLEAIGALLRSWREADSSDGPSERGSAAMIGRLRAQTGPRDAAKLVGGFLDRLDERTVDLREALEGWRGAEAVEMARSIGEAARAFEADEVASACSGIETVAGLGSCSVTMSSIERLERANQDLRATLSAA